VHRTDGARDCQVAPHASASSVHHSRTRCETRHWAPPVGAHDHWLGCTVEVIVGRINWFRPMQLFLFFLSFSFLFCFVFSLFLDFKFKFLLPNSYSDKIYQLRYPYEKFYLFIYVFSLYCIAFFLLFLQIPNCYLCIKSKFGH
jgi:hypothetical protein